MKKPTRKRRAPKGSLVKLAERAMKSAAKKVIEENKRFGEPLIVWENGRIKKNPASELP